MAAAVFFEGFDELGFAEIGPEGGGDDKFGVGNLPKEEIADAHFSAGADEEVGIGNVTGVEMLGDDLLVNFGGFEFAFLYFRGDGASGFNDFGAATVAEREDQRHTGVF